MDVQDLLMTAGRGLLVYGFMLVIIRLLGKRTVGNFTAFDLLVALMLGEVVDEIIDVDVSLAQGAVAVGVVAAAKYGTGWLSYWDHGLNRVLEGTPTPIVENGEMRREAMRGELMNEKDVMAVLRLQGISDMREVKVATLEVDGVVSVIKQDWAETVQKADLEQKRPSGHEPPEDKQTDSPRALGQED